MKVLKYKRGQIWWYKMSNNYDGSITGKTRPYLIISNDIANANARVMLGIPFTTAIKKYIPTHITLEFNDCENTLLAEQITSLNVDKISSYIGELDDEAMTKVEQCIKIAVGLDIENSQSGIILRSPTQLEKFDEVTDTKVTNDDGVYKLLTDKGKALMQAVTDAGLIKKRGPRIKYDDEYKTNYIDFYNKYGIDECLKKFGDKDEKAVRNKLYVFKKSLKEVTV